MSIAKWLRKKTIGCLKALRIPKQNQLFYRDRTSATTLQSPMASAIAALQVDYSKLPTQFQEEPKRKPQEKPAGQLNLQAHMAPSAARPTSRLPSWPPFGAVRSRFTRSSWNRAGGCSPGHPSKGSSRCSPCCGTRWRRLWACSRSGCSS